MPKPQCKPINPIKQLKFYLLEKKKRKNNKPDQQMKGVESTWLLWKKSTEIVDDGREMARKRYLSTDLKQPTEKIVRYYQAHFQIEFLYRDAKQF